MNSNHVTNSLRQRVIGGITATLRHLAHELPIVLMLACSFAALHEARFDWYAASDGHVMRVAANLNRWFIAHAGRKFAMEVEFGGNHDNAALPKTTLLELTPEAYEQYLNRASPVPRARLACVIDGVAKRLKVLKRDLETATSKKWRPVVGIDIDVTTVEGHDDTLDTGNKPWERRLTDKEGCFAGDPPCAQQIETEDDAMRCALFSLNEVADIVAIIYPRTSPEARRLRNKFIRSTCIDSNLGASKSRVVRYASAQLMFVPYEPIFEYPDEKRSLAVATLPISSQADFKLLPSPFPGIGMVMAAMAAKQSKAAPNSSPKLSEVLNVAEKMYCGDLPGDGENGDLIDDRLARKPLSAVASASYDHKTMRLGQVLLRVSTAAVAVPDNPRGQLATDIADALSGIYETDMYVLAVDAGTTEDKYNVPVLPSPVPGAWVHAAVATSVFAEQLKPAPPQWKVYLSHLFEDLLYGSLFIWALSLLTQFNAQRWPTSRQVVKMIAPLFVVAVLMSYKLTVTLEEFDQGHWNNPLLLLLGLTLHTYIESAAQPSDSRHTKSKQNNMDRILTVALQLLWGCIVLGAILYGTGLWQRAPVGISVAVVSVGWFYVSVARRYSSLLLPLPWRHL